jgi:hypothetical protein
MRGGLVPSRTRGCPIRIRLAHRSRAAPQPRFAALRVLLRLLAPRHPPCTFSRLAFPLTHSRMRFAPTHSILMHTQHFPYCAPPHSANVRTRGQTLLCMCGCQSTRPDSSSPKNSPRPLNSEKQYEHRITCRQQNTPKRLADRPRSTQKRIHDERGGFQESSLERR